MAGETLSSGKTFIAKLPKILALPIKGLKIDGIVLDEGYKLIKARRAVGLLIKKTDSFPAVLVVRLKYPSCKRPASSPWSITIYDRNGRVAKRVTGYFVRIEVLKPIREIRNPEKLPEFLVVGLSSKVTAHNELSEESLLHDDHVRPVFEMHACSTSGKNCSTIWGLLRYSGGNVSIHRSGVRLYTGWKAVKKDIDEKIEL